MKNRDLSILHLSAYDLKGGASMAGLRIHQAVLENGYNSQLGVLVKESDFNSVFELPVQNPKTRLQLVFQTLEQIRHQRKQASSGYESLGKSSANIVEYINNFPADIIHLHWIHSLLSIEDLAQIKKPLAWTLHDMWAFSGSRHYPEKSGWQIHNEKAEDDLSDWESEIDVMTWKQKKEYWTNPIQIITPSLWLAKKVKSSHLMHDWPIDIVANPLNVMDWEIRDQMLSRSTLGINQDTFTLAFGAAGGKSDHVKGFDLFYKSLQEIQQIKSKIQVLIFGGSEINKFESEGIEFYEFGYVSSINQLNDIYSASDALMVPSRHEVFGQVATESMACGTPVIGFTQTGLTEIIDHGKTGYLANYLDICDLASGINWIFNKNHVQKKSIQVDCRNQAMREWSSAVIGGKYENIYRKMVASTQHSH